jgi:hypothetical protein
MTDFGLLFIAVGFWWAGQCVREGLEDLAEAIRELIDEPDPLPPPPTPKEKA